VKNPRFCSSVCRTTSIAPSFRSRFPFPSRGFAGTPAGEAWPGLVWDVMSSAVAAALSKRSTELILLRHLAPHALSSASRRLSSCVLRSISASWSIFSVTVSHATRTRLLGNPLVRCSEFPYKVLRAAAGIPQKHASCGLWPHNGCCQKREAFPAVRKPAQPQAGVSNRKTRLNPSTAVQATDCAAVRPGQ